MIDQDIMWTPVDADSSGLVPMQEAAKVVEEWLAASPGAKDKPIDEILDPEYKGVFIFLADGDYEPDFTQPPLAYVAQRVLVPAYRYWNPELYGYGDKPTALREISSLVVSPEWQGQGIGSELLDAYTQFLLEERPTTALVAVAHPGSVPAFNNAGYFEIPPPDYEFIGTFTEQNLLDRVEAGKAAGKILMAYGESIN